MPLTPGNRRMARNSSSGSAASKARCGRSTDRSNRCSSRPASSRSNSRNSRRMLISASTKAAPGAPAAKPPQKRSEAAESPDARGCPACGAGRRRRRRRRASGRGDAFDPSQNPAAPGAPRPLGSLPRRRAPTRAACGVTRAHPPGVEQNDPGAPLDLSNGRSRTAERCPRRGPRGDGALGVPRPGRHGDRRGAQFCADEEFDIALAYLKQRAYEDAEKGFTGFLEKNPKNKLASDAIYYLGESFYLRGRQREAAEQYLKIIDPICGFAARAGGPLAPRPVAERPWRQGASLRDLWRNRPGNIPMLRPWSRLAPSGRPNARNVEGGRR